MPDRFARQRLIPGWDQRRLLDATAVVVGVGALGNEVAKNLALLGVGRLVLCDPDTVAVGNLSRSVLFGPADVGRPKVVAAAASLTARVPGLTVTTRDTDLVAGVGLGELADADVVVGCLDSRRARLQLLGRAALAGARLVDGGTHPWGGEVRVRVDPAEACQACGLTPAQRAEPDSPIHCGPTGITLVETQPASILSTSIVAGWMGTAVARLLLGQPLPWRCLDIDAATGSTTPVRLTRADDCPHHRPAGVTTSAPFDHFATVGHLLSALPAGSEPLAWGVFSLPGVCYHCSGTYDYGPRHVAGLVACPHCGKPIRPRMSRNLTDVARNTPMIELGIAAAEILAVRMPEGDYRWLRLST